MSKTLTNKLKDCTYQLTNIPISKLEYDINQPRKYLDHTNMVTTLKPSIEKHGIQQPITVTEYSPEKYKIIDGHRRYRCAKELGLSSVPCLVYSMLSEGELEVRRYEMQNLRRPWKPIEKSEAFFRIRNSLGFNSNQEMASYLGISESAVAGSLELRNQQYYFMQKLDDLSEAFQIEIVRLRPHLCKINDIEASEIIDILLSKIANGKIRSSKDIRIIKKAFMRVDLYSEQIELFLTSPEMKVSQLSESMLLNGFSANVQRVISDVSKKHSQNEPFTSKERSVLFQLKELIDLVS